MQKQKLTINLGYASDKGVKEENEDFYGASIPEEPQLTLKGITAGIADGMSGCEDGKTASKCCIIGFISDYYSAPDSWSVKTAGQKVLSATNTWLHSQGHNKYNTSKGLVSTLSILVIKSTTAHIFHIGDSRIYRLRKGNLEQMTHDHRIWVSDEKNYLSRAMGIEPRLEVDYKAFPVELGDIFLMTTDGVHDFVSEQFFRSQLNALATDPTTTAQTLLDEAVANNSDDNLTCQILRITGLPEPQNDELLRRNSNLPFPPPLEPGMILDGYKISKELHASKRTQIYLAYDTIRNFQVILKTPSILFEDDPHYIEHFLHEEWAGKRLNHSNVLKVLENDRKKSCIYYVTEYINGSTLREWMQRNPKADIQIIRKLCDQICKGLHAFHRMEMLHQDLKPDNIMINEHGMIKIIDFGSVKIAGIAEISPMDREEQENILGTLNYTAPEYHLGQNGDIRSDLFSVGVIIYEMLNATLPFGKTMPEKPNKIKLSKLQYKPSFLHNPMVPTWIDGTLKKATAINPQSRYNDLHEFLYDLNTPNKEFLKENEKLPLIEKNPVIFWKSVSAILLVLNIISLYL